MAAIALAIASVLAVVAPVPPAPSRWVTDTAGFLSPDTRAALDARLEAYEHATGHQVVVWIGRSIGDASLADWAVRTFAAWKVGRERFDDGIAIFVLADDRKIDIEVGYGLEDKVPDAVASRIIREVMTPRLRAGDRDGAITAGVNAVLTAIEGKPWIGPATTAPAAPAHERAPWTSWVFGGLVVLVLLVLGITHPRLALFMLWTVMSGGRGGGGGFGGGGGGFGGGGGRSGGGGARGGW